jgi:hypothetical protein
VKVVVAQGPIARGTPLVNSQLLFTVKEVPHEQVPDHCLTSLDQLVRPERFVVVKPMKAGEPLSVDYLMARNPGAAEQLLTIFDGTKKKVYARKANGRITLVESTQAGDDDGTK